MDHDLDSRRISGHKCNQDLPKVLINRSRSTLVLVVLMDDHGDILPPSTEENTLTLFRRFFIRFQSVPCTFGSSCTTIHATFSIPWFPICTLATRPTNVVHIRLSRYRGAHYLVSPPSTRCGFKGKNKNLFELVRGLAFHSERGRIGDRFWQFVSPICDRFLVSTIGRTCHRAGLSSGDIWEQ